MPGHSLGAAGAQEFIFCIAMLERSFLAPSRNIDDSDPAFEGLPIVRRGIHRHLRSALTTSFGFGGTNAALVVKKFGAID